MPRKITPNKDIRDPNNHEEFEASHFSTVFGIVLLFVTLVVCGVIFYLMLDEFDDDEDDEEERITINAGSDGVAFFVDGPSDSVKLMFAPEGSGAGRLAADLSIYNYPQPHIYKEKLYYISGGNLKRNEIVGNSVSDVLDVKAEGKNVVNEIFFHEGKLFYLYGEYCQLYLAKCDLKLYEYDFEKASSTMLAQNVKYRTLLGYVSAENALYMMHSEADAGCFFADAAKYDFAQKKLITAGKYNGCTDLTSTTTELTKGEKEFDAFLSRFMGFVGEAQYMQVRDGKIIYPVADVNPHPTWHTIRFVK